MHKAFNNKILKESIWAFLTKGITYVLFILTNIFIARRLGVESFGLWSLFLSIITVVFTLSYFGINASTQKFVAQHNGTEQLQNVLISSFKLRLLVSILFTVLVLFLHKYIAELIGYPELKRLFFFGAPLVFFSGLVEYFKTVFIGLHRVKYNFIINCSEYGLKLAFVLFFLLLFDSLLAIIAAFGISLAATTILGVVLLYFKFYRNYVISSKKMTKEIISYSYPLIIISIGAIVLTETDTIMIGVLSNTGEVGVYSVAKQIVLKLPHIALAISMGTMPVFAKLNESNIKQLRIQFNRTFIFTIIIYSVLFVILVLFAPKMIPLIFGLEYINAALPLQILSFYMLFMALSIIPGSLLDYVGKAKIRAYNISFTIILNILLNLLLIPKYGAVGAAIGTSISWLPYFILNWLEVRKTFNRLE